MPAKVRYVFARGAFLHFAAKQTAGENKKHNLTCKDYARVVGRQQEGVLHREEHQGSQIIHQSIGGFDFFHVWYKDGGIFPIPAALEGKHLFLTQSM